eukprot:m.418145 g.418145  ORF g.418145 m.418145 type:complete len:112 (+) comp30768_c0_seq1:495-830(+)
MSIAEVSTDQASDPETCTLLHSNSKWSHRTIASHALLDGARTQAPCEPTFYSTQSRVGSAHTTSTVNTPLAAKSTLACERMHYAVGVHPAKLLVGSVLYMVMHAASISSLG